MGVSSVFAFLSLSVHESCIHMVLSGEPQGAAPSHGCLEPSQRDLGFSIPRPSGVDLLWQGLLCSLRTLVSPPSPRCGHMWSLRVVFFSLQRKMIIEDETEFCGEGLLHSVLKCKVRPRG